MTAPFAPHPPRSLIVVIGAGLVVAIVLPFGRHPGWQGWVAITVIAVAAAALWGMMVWGITRASLEWWRGLPDSHWLARLCHRQRKRDTFGNRGEEVAAQFLRRLGYEIIDRQSRGRFGEIDLIAADGDVIVFVEVKTRTSTAAGDPTEAVTPAKQKKITQSALAYLKQRGWLQRRSRFDVIAILWADSDNEPNIRHYKHAFEATGFGQMYS